MKYYKDLSESELEIVRGWASQPWPLAQIQALLLQKFNKRYTISGVSKLLKRLREGQNEKTIAEARAAKSVSVQNVVDAIKNDIGKLDEIDQIRMKNRLLLKRVQDMAEQDLNSKTVDLLSKLNAIVNRDEESRRAEKALEGTPEVANSIVELFDEIDSNEAYNAKEPKIDHDRQSNESLATLVQ